MTTRGAIVWAELDPAVGHEQEGRRPVLVVSETRFNTASGTAIAFSLTTQKPRLDYPYAAEVPAGLLPKRSWVKLTQVRTLDTTRFAGQLGQASDSFVRHCLVGMLRHCGL